MKSTIKREFNNLVRRVQIWYLKRIARAAYVAYFTGFDQISCGHRIYIEISRSAYRNAKKYNNAMRRLKEIDSSMPEIDKMLFQHVD